MLFRLRMTVDEAITAYARLSEDVFSSKSVWSNMKTNASRLENAIAKLVNSSLNIHEGQAQTMSMLDDNGPKWRVVQIGFASSIDIFYSFVSASSAKNLSSSTLFRTYESHRHASYNCTIVEALRATTAEDPFFPSIDIGDVNLKETFIHGGLRLNSPVKAVLQEAELIFPDQNISCLLSIGSGAQGIIGFNNISTPALAKVLRQDINNGERISEEVAKELSNRKVFYCRLNVDHGLEGIGFEDFERLGDVRTHTQKYLEKHDVEMKASELVRVLNRRTGALQS